MILRPAREVALEYVGKRFPKEGRGFVGELWEGEEEGTSQE
jgi:hypothetical protein